MKPERHAVTGAFGYSGKYIASRLIDRGHEVITLTNSVDRANRFEGRVRPYGFTFDSPQKLTQTLQGVSVLYNTYWVRFNHKQFRHDDAVKNTLVLFEAAKAANVRRIIHISITNPSEDSPLEYFRGKARLERELAELGVSHAILRPTVLFGKEDILINNIAWALRRLPVFGVFGSGEYRLQPIYVDDLAALAVDQSELADDVVIDTIGPETFTYREMVEVIGEIIGKRRPVISVSPAIGFFAAWILGKCVGDVIITREEIEGLMADLLVTESSPTGSARLTDWVHNNAEFLGKRYTSELARRRNRKAEYESN